MGLRRLEDVYVAVVKPDNRLFSISHWRPSTSGKLMLRAGSSQLISDAKWISSELEDLLHSADDYPTCFLTSGDSSYWCYQGKWWVDNENYSADDIYALISSRSLRSEATLKRAHSISAMASEPTRTTRGHIPPDLRQLIWARYEGMCSACGSNVELQFDHIIPIALGGATSEENLQILCGPCNRSKGASIS